jgi:hypothetical protein
MGSDLASAHNRLSAIDDEEAVVKSKFKERRTTAQQSISSLSRDLDAGWTMQNVACRLAYGDPNPAEVTYYRKDNGQAVKTRAMNPEELQDELPLDGDVRVIPPAEAEASAEESASNVVEFFGKQDETTTDQPEPVEEPAELEKCENCEKEVSADENQITDDDVKLCKECWDDLKDDMSEPEPSDSPTPTKPKQRKPRGFSGPTNPSAW